MRYVLAKDTDAASYQKRSETDEENGRDSCPPPSPLSPASFPPLTIMVVAATPEDERDFGEEGGE